jgi:serine/threonine-protein kinase
MDRASLGQAEFTMQSIGNDALPREADLPYPGADDKIRNEEVFGQVEADPVSDLRSDPEHRRLGNYTLLSDLAKGGMAQVFVAQRDGAPEICVLKQLLVEMEQNETAVKRFHREAHVVSLLRHKNIARVLDAGLEGDTFCLAMEYIPGKDVESMVLRLADQGLMLPPSVTIPIALGVLDGLAYAHDASGADGAPLNLVHRDLSPRNVMLSFNGEVKIIDFGLARGTIDSFQTKPGMVLGTLRYMSPEQACTDPVDRRSDLYTFAVVLHEALTGRTLVRSGTPTEILMAVVREPAPRVSDLNPAIPPAVSDVIARALEKKAPDRIQTAAEFRDALRAAAGPELCDTSDGLLADFVSRLFQEDRQRSIDLIGLGHERFMNAFRESGQDAPDVELTTVRPRDLSGLPEIMAPTLTGAVRPSPLASARDIFAETRTASKPSSPSHVALATEVVERPRRSSAPAVPALVTRSAPRAPTRRPTLAAIAMLAAAGAVVAGVVALQRDNPEPTHVGPQAAPSAVPKIVAAQTPRTEALEEPPPPELAPIPRPPKESPRPRKREAASRPTPTEAQKPPNTLEVAVQDPDLLRVQAIQEKFDPMEWNSLLRDVEARVRTLPLSTRGQGMVFVQQAQDPTGSRDEQLAALRRAVMLLVRSNHP